MDEENDREREVELKELIIDYESRYVTMVDGANRLYTSLKECREREGWMVKREIKRMTDGTYFYCDGDKIIRKAYEDDILFEILQELKKKEAGKWILD